MKKISILLILSFSLSSSFVYCGGEIKSKTWYNTKRLAKQKGFPSLTQKAHAECGKRDLYAEITATSISESERHDSVATWTVYTPSVSYRCVKAPQPKACCTIL